MSIFTAILAFLKWETAYASIPGDVSGQITAFLNLLGSGWAPVLALFLFSAAMFGLWLGPDRLEAWTRWFSKYRTNRPKPTEGREVKTQEQVAPGDEELKQRSLRLADELYEFLEEYAEKDPRYTMWPNVGTNDTDPESQRRLDEFTRETMRYNDFAMQKYSRRFGGKVVALVGHLKQHGLWNPEEPEKLDDPVHPIDVRRIADHLSAIGHR